MEIGREFMKATGVPKIDESDQAKGIPRPPFESERSDIKNIIDLPDVNNIKVRSIDLREAIEKRSSVRKYSKVPLSLDELSYLLWCTQGVRRVTKDAAYRTVPSAGNRHALETYLVVNNVEGLEPGLYKYMAMDNKLAELLCCDNISQKLREACPLAQFIEHNAATFIWTAVFYRMNWRHGERGYRYIHLDAGHVCQNLYLAVQSIDSGVCGISVFKDEMINEFLKIDGEKESVIYMASVGKNC